jgi:hypothetical protein
MHSRSCFSEKAKNKVWDQVKQRVNPNWPQELTAENLA